MKIISNTVRGAFLVLFCANGANASACDDALSALRSHYQGGDKAALLRAASELRQHGGCNEVTVNQALSQTSAVMAGTAQRFVAAGDIDAAIHALEGAPGLHWAVQAVRADIAAKKGNRAEAAALYNSALDTITDPALTQANPKLAPMAARITSLAQENMMLAGSLSSALTRGGTPSGVFRVATRGITIEAAPESTGDAAASAAYAAAQEGTGLITGQTAETHGDQYVSTGATYGASNDSYAVADAAASYLTAIFLPIRFKTGSADLESSGRYEAETVANFLLANQVEIITLVGHTDEVGSEAYNLELSLRRAESVRLFLLSRGVKARILVDAKGETSPPELVDQTIYSIEERRAIARRVELVLEG